MSIALAEPELSYITGDGAARAGTAKADTIIITPRNAGTSLIRFFLKFFLLSLLLFQSGELEKDKTLPPKFLKKIFDSAGFSIGPF
jgi:hypothetical protein